jgi:hypothetical protein
MAKTRLEEYEICKIRGHVSGNTGISNSSGDWSICKYCGIMFRYEVTKSIIEIPFPEVRNG